LKFYFDFSACSCVITADKFAGIFACKGKKIELFSEFYAGSGENTSGKIV